MKQISSWALVFLVWKIEYVISSLSFFSWRLFCSFISANSVFSARNSDFRWAISESCSFREMISSNWCFWREIKTSAWDLCWVLDETYGLHCAQPHNLNIKVYPFCWVLDETYGLHCTHPHNLNIKVYPIYTFLFHNRVQHISRIYLDCCSLSIDGNLIPGT